MNISWEAGAALAVASSMLVVAIRLYVEKSSDHAPRISHPPGAESLND